MSHRRESRPSLFSHVWSKAFAAGRRNASSPARPQLEYLEDRVVPAVINVNTTADIPLNQLPPRPGDAARRHPDRQHQRRRQRHHQPDCRRRLQHQLGRHPRPDQQPGRRVRHLHQCHGQPNGPSVCSSRTPAAATPLSTATAWRAFSISTPTTSSPPTTSCWARSPSTT